MGFENLPLCQIFLTVRKQQLPANKRRAFNAVAALKNNTRWDLSEYFSPYFTTITMNLKENKSC